MDLLKYYYLSNIKHVGHTKSYVWHPCRSDKYHLRMIKSGHHIRIISYVRDRISCVAHNESHLRDWKLSTTYEIGDYFLR